jgi:hypothetical protein
MKLSGVEYQKLVEFIDNLELQELINELLMSC